LAVAAILEIWYLFSLGMKGAAWFIHDPSTLLIIVNGIMLIVFALAQMYATMNALFDLGSEWDIYFNYEWGLWGIFISIILYTLSRIFNILSDERELLIVLCVLLGQIPQAINMWRAAARYKYSVVNRTLTFIAFYLIVITGTICLTALMLVALIVGLVAYVVMFLLSRESGVSVSSDSETVILKDGTELEGDGNNYRSKDGGYWRKTVGGFERW
jgi:hypothetical protein